MALRALKDALGKFKNLDTSVNDLSQTINYLKEEHPRLKNFVQKVADWGQRIRKSSIPHLTAMTECVNAVIYDFSFVTAEAKKITAAKSEPHFSNLKDNENVKLYFFYVHSVDEDLVKNLGLG